MGDGWGHSCRTGDMFGIKEGFDFQGLMFYDIFNVADSCVK